MGDQVVPEFSVFQTPPDPTATYHTLSLSGWTAISAIRPDKNAGPIFLNLKASKEISSAFSTFFFLRCASRLKLLIKRSKLKE